MEFLVHLAEVLVGDVGVDLGSTNIAVPEHTLDAAQIGTIHQEVGRKAMAHRVRADVLCDTS